MRDSSRPLPRGSCLGAPCALGACCVRATLARATLAPRGVSTAPGLSIRCMQGARGVPHGAPRHLSSSEALHPPVSYTHLTLPTKRIV